MNRHSNWNGGIAPIDVTYVALVVGYRNGRDVVVGQVAVASVVADELRGIAADAAEVYGGLLQQPWTAESAWEREELRRIQWAQLDGDNAVLRALRALEYDDLPASDLRSRPIIFYAIVTGCHPSVAEEDERRILLRKTNPRLAAERKVVTLLSGDELSKISEPLFTFDRRVDMIIRPSLGILALNESPFDILFRDTPELLAKTPAYARDLATSLPLARGSEDALVSAAVKYARVRRRVLAAAERGHLARVTPAQLRAEFKRQGMNADDFMYRGKLTITEANIIEVVRVLNEDLLTGGLSGQRFDVERKSAL